jgi:hypothetical protein
VFWVRIRSDPELFGRVGSGSRTVPDLFDMKFTLHSSLRQVSHCLPGFFSTVCAFYSSVLGPYPVGSGTIWPVLVWQPEAGHSSLRQATQCFLPGFTVNSLRPLYKCFGSGSGTVWPGRIRIPDRTRLLDMKSPLHSSLRQVTQCFLPGFSLQFAPFIQGFWVRIRSYPELFGRVSIPVRTRLVRHKICRDPCEIKYRRFLGFCFVQILFFTYD